MMLTGEKVLADEAFRIGLVNHLYPKEELFPAAMTMAKAMASKSQLALQITKGALNMALNGSNYEDAVRIEDRGQAIMGLAMTAGIKTDIQK